MNNFSKIIISIFLFFVLFSFSGTYIFAEGEEAGDVPKVAPTAVKLDNPLTGVDDLRGLVGKIIQTVLGVVGSLALLMFVYGGLIWMTATGNEERIKKGRGILLWAVIGMVVIFTSYTVLQFVVGIFGAT